MLAAAVHLTEHELGAALASLLAQHGEAKRALRDLWAAEEDVAGRTGRVGREHRSRMFMNTFIFSVHRTCSDANTA